MKSLRYLAGVPLCTGLAMSALHAQSAPTSEQPEPVLLNEFRVDATKDQGYRATNTISGTRLNMPIRDVPMPIQVTGTRARACQSEKTL